MGWSAQYFTTIIIEGNSPNTGIFIYSPTPGFGNLIGSWAAQGGTDQFGNQYPQGIFVKQGVLSGAVINSMCSIVGTPISGSALNGCHYNGGTIKETVITFDSTAGALFGYATTTSTTTINSSGNFTTPATPTPLQIDCYGAGAGGIWGGNFGAGGGAGEWARDIFTYPASTVIPVVIGAGGTGGTSTQFASSGGATTFNGSDVVANGGSRGNTTTGGLGGTGSGNQFHNDGGRGGNTVRINGNGGGGGGGSGSPNGTGNHGGDNSSSGTAPGGAALGPGGAGGAGGQGSDGIGTGATNGSQGTVPGGGGGGGGNNNNNHANPGANGAAGVAGQCIVTFSTSQALNLSVSPISGVDPLTSTAFPAGFMGPGLALQNQGASPSQVANFSTIWSDSSGYPRVLAGDTSDTTPYNIGETVQVNPSAQTVNTTSFTAVPGLSVPVGIGTYYFEGSFRTKQGAVANAVGNMGFQGPAISNALWYYWYGAQGAAFASVPAVQGALATVNILNATGANVENQMHFKGTVTFTAAGTFQCGGIASAGNTFTVQPGCIFKVRPMR